jgi:WD40 repeat protein
VGAALGDNDYPVQHVAFSPDGKLFAAAGGDGVVRLGDPMAHQQIGATIPARSALALSPDGRTLATAGPSAKDPAARLWDTATRRQVGPPLEPTEGRKPRSNPHAHALWFTPDGRKLVTADPDGVRIWDAAAGRQIGPVFATGKRLGLAQLSPDGTFIAVQESGSVAFWRIADRRPAGPRVRVPNVTEVISAMAISPDGRALAVAGYDRTVRVFDVRTGRQTGAPLPGGATDGIFDDLAFSPDGRTLAGTADDTTVRLWDLASRRPAGAALTGHTGTITTLAFGPDGQTLVTGSMDDTVRLWDLRTYRQIGPSLTGHARSVTSVAFGRDGSTVASVGEDGTARLWNIALPADPVAAACANAGRSFTRDEWELYVPGEEFQRVCQ